ncbi:MAG: hypothetical protein R2941_24305 [Desulfobacterales bacterium]
MTADSWRFKTREWMKRGIHGSAGERIRMEHGCRRKSNAVTAVLPGFPIWRGILDSADTTGTGKGDTLKISKGEEISGKKLTFSLHREIDLEKVKNSTKKDFRRIFPSEIYTALLQRAHGASL